MNTTLEFADLLELIDERAAAFRAVIAAAPSLDVQVPTCPEWTLFDLAKHLGEGRRAWAATVIAGPDAQSKAVPVGEPVAPTERAALLDWLAASTAQLLNALREAGPDRGCWTWWGDSQSPATCGAVARHQLQEVAVHTYDAQVALGVPEPLPTEVAVDGVEEFLSTCNATTVPWPHQAAFVEYRSSEGHSWRLLLSAAGLSFTRLPEESTPPDATPGHGVVIRGAASDLVLFMYGRREVISMAITGDKTVIQQLIDWDPSA